MNLKNFVALIGCQASTMFTLTVKGQAKAVLFDGVLVAGYVDNGTFINCAVPSIKLRNVGIRLGYKF